MKKILLRVGIALWSVVLVLYLIPPASASNPGINPNNNLTVQNGNVGIGTFTANPGTYATIYTAPTAGNNFSKLIGLTASNLDTSTAHVVTCRIVNGSSIVGMQFPTSAAIAAQTGSIAPVNMLSTTLTGGEPVDQWGNSFIYLPAGYTVQCTYTTALSNGYVAVMAQAGEF